MQPDERIRHLEFALKRLIIETKGYNVPPTEVDIAIGVLEGKPAFWSVKENEDAA